MIFKEGDSFQHQFIVNENVYEGFLKLFNDRNPLHTNETFALSKGFKGKVMHGNLLNGFLSYFIGERLPTKDVIIHSQTIEYKKPVYLDDVLSFEATVIGVYESINTVEFKFYFANKESVIISKGKIQIGILL